MKKMIPRRPLVLTAETVRILAPRDLNAIAGGFQRESTALAFSCNGSCACA